MVADPYPISILPAPYDIVWCRFPFHPDLGTPGPKPRPALVRNAAIMDDDTGEVEVVYGTTNLKLTSRLYDFVVSKASEMDACGLYRATRFDLDKKMWLPWNTDWFEVLNGYASPVIGSLTEEGKKMLQLTVMVKQRQQADPDA
ncbi:MAG: hypothetical protein AB7D33_07990 [Sphingobium sp.]